MKRLIFVLLRLLVRCYPRAWRRRYGERCFWHRWVLALCLAGAVGGLIFRLTDITIILVTPASGIGNFMWGRLFALPFLCTLSLALGIAQRRALQALMPTISRWWIGMLLLGPAITLAIMTTDHRYSLLPDLFYMTGFLFGQMGQASLPTGTLVMTFDRLVLSTILPVLFYIGMVAAFQAYVLKGVIMRAGWWIVVAIIAALGGLATLRLTAPLHLSGYRLQPNIEHPGLLTIDLGVTAIQLSLACAVYGIVSGAGLLFLRRLPETPQAAPRGARTERS